MAQLVKISKPRLSGVQQRLRLFEQLDAAFGDSPVVWIAAPAGAGKTTLVASYLDASRLDCLWYQLDETDADPGGFFHYIRRAAEPLLGSETLPAFGADDQAELKLFARRFFSQLFDNLQGQVALAGQLSGPAARGGHCRVDRPGGRHGAALNQVGDPEPGRSAGRVRPRPCRTSPFPVARGATAFYRGGDRGAATFPGWRKSRGRRCYAAQARRRLGGRVDPAPGTGPGRHPPRRARSRVVYSGGGTGVQVLGAPRLGPRPIPWPLLAIENHGARLQRRVERALRRWAETQVRTRPAEADAVWAYLARLNESSPV